MATKSNQERVNDIDYQLLVDGSFVLGHDPSSHKTLYRNQYGAYPGEMERLEWIMLNTTALQGHNFTLVVDGFNLQSSMGAFNASLLHV